MSTKFVSKNSNYMVVLKPGVEGNRNLGTHSIPGLYIKFQSGIVDIKDESIAQQLRDHPSFNTEFVEVKQEDIDPYAAEREEIEPAHVISEIKYGHNEKAAGTSIPTKMSPQLRKLIEGEALKMLPGILKSNPKFLQDVILGLAAEMKDTEEVAEIKSEDSPTNEVSDETTEDDGKEAVVEEVKTTPKTKGK